jgi:hypothetical protein
MTKAQFHDILRGVILIIALIAALLGYSIWVGHQNDKNALNYENQISALTDSVVKLRSGEFSKHATELTPEQIMKSDAYQKLDSVQKAFIEELSRTKNLLAAQTIKLEAAHTSVRYITLKPQPTMKDVAAMDSVSKDSLLLAYITRKVSIDVGDSLLVHDSTAYMSYRQKLFFNSRDSIKSILNYKYTTDISSTWTRDKKGMITVTNKISDTSAVLKSGTFIMIPPKKPSVWGKVFGKAKLIGIAAGAFYLGAKL